MRGRVFGALRSDGNKRRNGSCKVSNKLGQIGPTHMSTVIGIANTQRTSKTLEESQSSTISESTENKKIRNRITNL